ncbi:M48 family metalloprotease [Algoriphagus halophytocola]|uniref:M48 family metalloprotease n=1 Tax=Algoriphagus halophytocola TaxID=2991499 RepID=A0ABY6MDY3_9BACT|nr:MULTISPECIES: M56 family metallopeptidase [unclassified Algoriphagus]UZD21119.1 M48 family metalloprotease [Algoriphagus sp. TR-M5]WBL42287.1 M48 family metalloprotease [Algoriphagus sp. TR-M9]
MNLLNDWIPDSLLYATGWTLVHTLWQLVIIAGTLWLLLKAFHKKSPAFKYHLALGSLALAVLAALATFTYEISNFTPTPVFERLALEGMSFQQVKAGSDLGMEGWIQVLINWIELQLPVLVNFWFVGAILFMFRLFNSLSEISTLRKTSQTPQDFELEKKLYRLMGKMNISKNVALRLTSHGVSPITFGYLKPIILIPIGLLVQLSPSQLEAIIAHELAHVKRNDYLINIFQSALEVLFFYHPCYWWMNQTIKELRENAADDLAVQVGIAPKELAYSLSEVLNFAKQNPPELALAAARKRHNPTLQRIKRILGQPAQTYPQNPIISIPMLLTLLLSAGLMASAQQDVPVKVELAEPVSSEVKINSNSGQNVHLNPHVNVNSNVHMNADHDIHIEADTIVEKNLALIIKDSTEVTTGKHIWVTKDNEVIELKDPKSYKLKIVADTIISEGDTIIVKGSNNFVHKSTADMDWEGMPVLELSDVPEPPTPPAFPEEFMAEMPEFSMAPMAPMPPIAPMPPMEFIYGDEEMFFNSDTVKNMTPEQRKQWEKEMEKKAKEWAKIAEEKAAKWQEENQEAIAKWKANEGEFRAKMEQWEKEMQPKMEAFQKKMEEWQKAQEPKMKEFEAKMKAWEKENQPKIEEFQRKMEIWQKENAAKMEEFKRKLEEELKNENDDN